MTGITLGVRSTSAVLLLATLRAISRAQSPPAITDPQIVMDLPDVTESAGVVPKGGLQLENGITWTSDHGAGTIDLSETLMRFGISNRTEIRIVVPNYLDGLSSRDIASGFGDIAVGMKQQLGPLPGGFDLSVIAALSLPTGADRVSSHGFDPFVNLPWSKDSQSRLVHWRYAFRFLEHGKRQAEPDGEQAFYLERIRW